MMQNENYTCNQIYRIDKFTVPLETKNEFITEVESSIEFIKTIPGCNQQFLLEELDQENSNNTIVTTVVEWENLESFKNAKNLVKEKHTKDNYNPQEILKRLHVRLERMDYLAISITR